MEAWTGTETDTHSGMRMGMETEKRMGMKTGMDGMEMEDGDTGGEERMNKYDLNDVLEKIPLGWFHWRLLLITGLANAADGMEVSLLAFMSVCAGLDWDLSDSQVASIASVVFAGELVGSLIWGPLADIYGRKRISVYSIIVVCVFGYLSAVAPSFVVLILFRFGVGIGVGGMAVPFDLLAELLPTSHRGRFLIYLQGFWTIGAAYVVTMAWLLMDRGGWRLVTVMTAVPVTVSLILAVIYLPESPRWLLIKNRPQDAADLVTHIAQVNGTPLTEPLQLKLLSSVSEETVSFAEFLKPSAQQKLFIPMWIVWFCFGFGYYGVVLLMVRVFEDRSGVDDEEQTCDFDYGNILINSSTEVLAVVMLIFMIEPVGRIKTMFFFFFTAGVSVLFIAMPMSPITFTFVAAIVRIAAMGANLSTWVATAEIFPTRLRATGHALATAMERLGSLLSPFLVDSKSMGLGLVSGVLCAIHMTGMVCTLALPETQGKDLDAPLSSQSQGDEFQRSNGDSFDNSRDSKSLLSVNDQIELSNANVTVRKD